MKAIICTKYGDPDVLQLKEVARPAPKDNEVLIRIKAAAVTLSDSMMRKGTPFLVRFFSGFIRPKTAILGAEFAGEIESIGKDVKRFKKGDQVFGSTGNNCGCYAEFVCIPEDGFLAIKPSNITYDEAAPVCGALAAWNFLADKATIQRGQKVLIIGASGSIGTAAIQLAKHFGANVTGVCSTSNIELLKSLGADQVIDYTKVDFTQNDQLYDVIFDAESKSSFSRSKGSLTQNGVYLKTYPDLLILLQAFWTSKIGNLIGRQNRKKAKFSATGILPVSKRLIFLNELIELMEVGILKPVIDRRYPLEQVTEAFRYAERGHKNGTVVISMEPTKNHKNYRTNKR